ncbi:MAG: hypothetical protein WAU07_05480, partial [Microgenomates group bacterium]
MKIEHLSQSKDSSTERPIRRGIFDHDPINIDEDIVKLTIPERSIKGGSKRKRVERALRKSITDWQNTTTLAMLRPDMLSSLGNTIQESVLKVFDIYKELHTNHVSESKNFESPDTNAMWITRPLTDCALAPITLIGDREGFVLSPHVLNPVSYAIISEIYNDLPRFFQLSGENVNHIDEIIALGYLFGKFDPSNPNAEYYIQVLKSLRVRPENTKLFGSIIRIDDDKERVKPARVEALLKLKKFWPDVFAYYWQSSRHLNQFSSAQPLSQQTLTEAGVKGTPPLSDLFPIEDHDNGRSPRAESITQATFQQRRSTLQKSIGSFLSAYTGSKVSYEVIRHSMSKELSHQILKSLIVQLSNKSPEDITHEVLFQISAELQATIHRYNPAFFDITLPRHKFSLLAPIEQICIVAFTSFLHNGDASLKGNTESIKIIDQLLIPILNRHTATNLDVIHIKEPDLQDPNFDTTVQVELDKAKKRLSSLNIADHGLTSTQHPDIEKHIANQESLFLNMFGPLSNTLPEGYRKTAFGSFALSAGMLGIAFLASVATSVQSIYLTEGINASTPVIIGGLITALSSTSLYKYFHAVNTRKRLTYSTYNPIDTPDDEIKELRKDLKKIESRILLDSIRVSLATIVVLAGAMRAAKSLDTFIRSIDTVTSTDSDLNNAEKSGIGNHERAPGTGRATFFVYGQKDNGFW